MKTATLSMNEEAVRLIAGNELARNSCVFIGRPYSQMDCQQFIEASLRECRIKADLPGSNAWYRKMTWVGTPEECKALLGKIPVGAFLFIHDFDGGEEKRGYHDGLGNASHIGIYTGMSGKDMLECGNKSGEKQYNFGNGAIHSSQSRGFVCTSSFAGKSIKGGWNKVGLWEDEIDYGGKIIKMAEKAKIVLPAGSTGSTVNMRSGPSSNDGIEARLAVGRIVDVIQDKGQWCLVRTDPEGNGWIMSNYLEYVGQYDDDSDGVTIEVDARKVRAVYDEIGDWLGLRR